MKFFSLLVAVTLSIFLYAQEARIVQRTIHWGENQLLIKDTINGQVRQSLSFEGCYYPEPSNMLPYYSELVEIDDANTNYKVQITQLGLDSINAEMRQGVTHFDDIPYAIKVLKKRASIYRKPFLQISFLPLVRNEANHQIQKVLFFSLKISKEEPISVRRTKSTQSYASNSVLSAGSWYKIKIQNDGIYKLTYSQIKDMGFDDPENIKIFGNGGDQLPYMNAEERYDDLQENAIFMEKGTNGVFDEGDYVLFYGKGTTSWKYDTNSNMFLHSLNDYSNEAYYFITTSDIGIGEAVSDLPLVNGTSIKSVNTFTGVAFHEEELKNLLGSGRLWVGEQISQVSTYTNSLNFPNIVNNEPLKIKWGVVGRASGDRTFHFKVDNQVRDTLETDGVTLNNFDTQYANTAEGFFEFLPAQDNILLEVLFNNELSSDNGYLNYYTINVTRNLQYTGNPFYFRLSAHELEAVTEVALSGINSNVVVWDISDPTSVREVVGTYSGTDFIFTVSNLADRHFIALETSGTFPSPIVSGEDNKDIGPLENQNLHATQPHTLLIVSHTDFIEEANRLADFHREKDNMSVFVTAADKVFNEFSSGTRDASAIRDFARMLYDRSPGNPDSLHYLLLFGDGSYNNRSDQEGNPNYIPTYQSLNSLLPPKSYVTDDFFGLLDDEEGEAIGLLDIGVGRLPVNSTEDQTEAKSVVDKIMGYSTTNNFNDWRNTICFIGDDEQNNIHQDHAEELANYVSTNYPTFHIEKIYLDAYKQENTASGSRYPDVNQTIQDNINKGILIFNYNGHGGERGLAHEHILEASDIDNFKNKDKLPLFVTATCEFSRFDNIHIGEESGIITEESSAGEYAMINPKGGAIALFTTTRVVYANKNKELNKRFYYFAFEKDNNGNRYRLGDLIRLAKNAYIDENKLNFTLLGDPALEFGYPEMLVLTDSINHEPVGIFSDTIKAYSRITISGYVAYEDSTRIEDFNGIIYPTVYDKNVVIPTLGNDPSSVVVDIVYEKNKLFKGKVSVKNGYFNFSFVVPKDISYKPGYGRVIYYSTDSVIDAHGCYSNFIIGGTSEEIKLDTLGPQIELYMNNELFASGGITDKNPTIFAKILDLNGINMVGNGIGHDIIGILDEDNSHPIILNDYFESDLDSDSSGTVSYKLINMEPGIHQLSMRVWDIYNNSASASIEFEVLESDDLVINNLHNYPNPVLNDTWFVFEHNFADEDLEVEIHITDLSGRVVRKLRDESYADGFSNQPIYWNGRSSDGRRMAAGIYPYRVITKTSSGQKVTAFNKLVIIN